MRLSLNCTPFVRQYDMLSNEWGAGIMRVIPVENAIPAEAQQIDKERVSYYIEKNAKRCFRSSSPKGREKLR